MTVQSVLVVGAGIGGLRTVEQLRRKGFTGRITLVGAEDHLPYDRPPLTKQVLRGEREMPALRTEYDSLDVRTVLGHAVVSLDTAQRLAVLADGSTVGYDVAVLATGARPRWLPGVSPRPGLHVLRTIEDSLALRKAISSSRAVTVVGGGFIGCEVAASARAMDASVTLVEALPAPLVRVIGPAASAEIVALHERHGVRVISGTGITEVRGDERVEAIVLSDGQRLQTSEVVLGLGVVPDLDWLTGSGVDIDYGIVCADTGLTSVPDVYAVGDAARWWHPLAGEHRRIEHWTSAGEQAEVVAANIVREAASETHRISGVPYFWSDQYDVKIQAFGFLDPTSDAEVLHPNGRTVVVYSKDGTLTAVLGLSAARSVIRLRPLIAARAPLSAALDLLAG